MRFVPIGRARSPWAGRVQGLVIVVLLAVAANVWGWWPAGVTVWLALAFAAGMCPQPEYFEIETSGEKTAMVLHHMRGVLAGGGSIWRTGPPLEPDYPAFSPETLRAKEGPPPTRWRPVTHVALAAAGCAAAAGLIDYGIHYAMAHPAAPDVSQWRLDAPGWAHLVTVPLSALFGWWAAMAVGVGRRQILSPPTMGVPPAARFADGFVGFVADTLVPISERGRRRPTAAVIAVVVAAGGALFAMWWFTAIVEWIGWPVGAGLVLLAAAALLVAGPMRAAAIEQRSAWEADRGNEMEWGMRWTNARLGLDEPRTPLLHEIVDYPEGSPQPTYRTLLFLLAPGTQFANVANSARQMASAIGRHTVVIERFKQLGSTQEHLMAFSLSHELTDLGESPHLNPLLDDETLGFAARWAVISAFQKLKLGTPMFLSAERITNDKSPLVMLTTWDLTEGRTFSDVAAVTQKLEELLDCGWCRPFQVEGSGHLELVYGVRPADADFQEPADQCMQLMQKIDWSYYMQMCGLTGSDGRSPVLHSRDPAALGLEELTFRYATGMDFAMVSAALEKLKTISGYSHIELSAHPSEPALFTVLAGHRDPLAGLYPFMDYTDEILREPVRGEPFTDWAVGMTSSGRLKWYQWDAEEPHLLIAGSSGSGKSGVINNFLCQLMHNNHPDDVRIWLVEPKNELHAYKNVEHVTRFLDSSVTDDSPHEAFAALMREAIAEMKARYAAMSAHPSEPQKIAECRGLAKADPEGSGHLNFPYVFLVVEECANFFTKPLAQDREAHAEIQSLVQKLARESRAAGIYLIPATQYPTKENIPMTLKNQCRRLGLPVPTWQVSTVIIDRPGLEKLSGAGRGELLEGSRTVGFRGLFMERSEDGDNPRDDRAQIIAGLPRNDNWPKIPDDVTPSALVKPVGTIPDAAPIPPPAPPSERPARTRADDAWDNRRERLADDGWDNRRERPADDGWDNELAGSVLGQAGQPGGGDFEDDLSSLPLPEGWENDPRILAWLAEDGLDFDVDPDDGGKRRSGRRRKESRGESRRRRGWLFGRRRRRRRDPDETGDLDGFGEDDWTLGPSFGEQPTAGLDTDGWDDDDESEHSLVGASTAGLDTDGWDDDDESEHSLVGASTAGLDTDGWDDDDESEHSLVGASTAGLDTDGWDDDDESEHSLVGASTAGLDTDSWDDDSTEPDGVPLAGWNGDAVPGHDPLAGLGSGLDDAEADDDEEPAVLVGAGALPAGETRRAGLLLTP